MDDGAVEVFLAVLNGPSGPTPEELLSKTRWCPTLVLWGSDDPFTPLSGGMHPGINFSEHNPDIKLEVVDNGGHCPHDSCPAWVNERLVKFVMNPLEVVPIRSPSATATVVEILDQH
jgi:pimeloyl-ACP methyl ester carboxylesterase